MTVEDARRQHILRAAARMSAQRGLDGVRLRDVANAAGVSIGSIQHHFETRELLLREAFEWALTDLVGRRRSASAGESGPWRRFELLVRELSGDPDLLRRCATWTEFCAGASRHPRLREGVRRVHDEWHSLVADIVEAGVRCGEFTPAVPAATAVGALTALVDGCDMAVAAGGGMTPDRYADLVLGTARALLGVREETG